jgi:DNA-binding IclR family transcriptional regulator
MTTAGRGVRAGLSQGQAVASAIEPVDAKTYPLVENLDRGLRILEMFSAADTALTVAEIAKRGDIPTASAYRIVHTLERRGYLRRDQPQGPLKLGLPLLRLSWLVQQSLDVRSAAQPVMHRLASEVGETAILLIPQEYDAVCIDCVEGSSPIRPRSMTVGERRPFNAGAAAMALFAHLSEDHRERVLSRPFEGGTRRTETDPDKLRQDIARIRARGYASSVSWLIEGTAAVAAPIFGPHGDAAIAALALTGIEQRMVGLETVVMAAAEEISKAMGATST